MIPFEEEHGESDAILAPGGSDPRTRHTLFRAEELKLNDVWIQRNSGLQLIYTEPERQTFVTWFLLQEWNPSYFLFLNAFLFTHTQTMINFLNNFSSPEFPYICDSKLLEIYKHTQIFIEMIQNPDYWNFILL